MSTSSLPRVRSRSLRTTRCVRSILVKSRPSRAREQDGSKDEIPLTHTFNAGQIEWVRCLLAPRGHADFSIFQFKAGSALNLVRVTFCPVSSALAETVRRWDRATERIFDSERTDENRTSLSHSLRTPSVPPPMHCLCPTGLQASCRENVADSQLTSESVSRNDLSVVLDVHASSIHLKTAHVALHDAREHAQAPSPVREGGGCSRCLNPRIAALALALLNCHKLQQHRTTQPITPRVFDFEFDKLNSPLLVALR